MTKRPPSSFIPRRAILAGMGVGAAGMFLRPMFASAADVLPKRLLIVHRPCGTRPETFFPQGGDASNFTLPNITKSFEPLRNDLVILNGITCPRETGWKGDQHSAGLITMMTGKRFIGIPGTADIELDPNAKNVVAAEKSIDQFLLEKSDLLKGRPIGSIQSTAFRPSGVGLPAFRVMSYSKSNGPMFPESRPGTLFDNLFGAGAGLGADALARLRAQNASILDFVHKDLTRLRSHVPSSQLPKLDAHLDGIQKLEAGIATSGISPGAMCLSKPMQEELPAATGDKSIDEAQHLACAKNQLAIISAAFQCDLSRVATFSFAHGNSTLQFAKIVSGAPKQNDGNNFGGHHDVSHSHDGNAEAMQARIDQVYCETLSAFLQGMKAIPEGSGNMLDNTLVVFFSEVCIGDSHSIENMPLMMFGGKNLKLAQGQHLHFNKKYMNDVWTSVANAFGVPLASYGDAAYGKGSVTGLFT